MTTTQHTEPDLNVETGVLIHTHMFRQRITQAQVAAALGIGQSTVSAKLRGKVAITVTELMRIARLLGVQPGDLLPYQDSNLEPSGYWYPQVSGGAEVNPGTGTGAGAVVVELAGRRAAAAAAGSRRVG